MKTISLNQGPIGAWTKTRFLADEKSLYSKIVSIAGEGDRVAPEYFNLPRYSFAYDTIYVVRLGQHEVAYSLDEATGELDLELIRFNALSPLASDDSPSRVELPDERPISETIPTTMQKYIVHLDLYNQHHERVGTDTRYVFAHNPDEAQDELIPHYLPLLVKITGCYLHADIK